jgi:hypothetical protein
MTAVVMVAHTDQSCGSMTTREYGSMFSEHCACCFSMHGRTARYRYLVEHILAQWVGAQPGVEMQEIAMRLCKVGVNTGAINRVLISDIASFS